MNLPQESFFQTLCRARAPRAARNRPLTSRSDWRTNKVARLVVASSSSSSSSAHPSRAVATAIWLGRAASPQRALPTATTPYCWCYTCANACRHALIGISAIMPTTRARRVKRREFRTMFQFLCDHVALPASQPQQYAAWACRPENGAVCNSGRLTAVGCFVRQHTLDCCALRGAGVGAAAALAAIIHRLVAVACAPRVGPTALAPDADAAHAARRCTLIWHVPWALALCTLTAAALVPPSVATCVEATAAAAHCSPSTPATCSTPSSVKRTPCATLHSAPSIKSSPQRCCASTLSVSPICSRSTTMPAHAARQRCASYTRTTSRLRERTCRALTRSCCTPHSKRHGACTVRLPLPASRIASFVAVDGARSSKRAADTD